MTTNGGTATIYFSQSDYGDTDTNGSDGGVFITDFNDANDRLVVTTDSLMDLSETVTSETLEAVESGVIITVSNDTFTITYERYEEPSYDVPSFIRTEISIDPDAIEVTVEDGNTIVSVGDAEVAILLNNTTEFDPSLLYAFIH